MSDDAPVVMLLEAGDAANRLSVSASGLRRLGLIYEEVYEELPRKPKSNNRMWPEEAIERLQTARALLQAEKYRTIQEALEAIKHGLVNEAEIEAPKQIDSTQQALGLLIEEVRQLRAELQDMKQAKELPSSTEETLKDSHAPIGTFSKFGSNWGSRIDRFLDRFRGS